MQIDDTVAEAKRKQLEKNVRDIVELLDGDEPRYSLVVNLIMVAFVAHLREVLGVVEKHEEK